jgi:hypothetical protein
MVNIMIASAAWVITVILFVSVISGFISKRVSNKVYGSIVVSDKKLSDVQPAVSVKVPVAAVPVKKKPLKKKPKKMRMAEVKRHIDVLC